MQRFTTARSFDYRSAVDDESLSYRLRPQWYLPKYDRRSLCYAVPVLSIINFYLSQVDNILDLASDLSGLAWDSWKRNSIDGSYAASTEINMPRISPNMHVSRIRIVSALNFLIPRSQFRNIGIFKAGQFFYFRISSALNLYIFKLSKFWMF